MLILKHYRNTAIGSVIAPVLWIQSIKPPCSSNLDLRYFIFLLINSPLRLSTSEIYLKMRLHNYNSNNPILAFLQVT